MSLLVPYQSQRGGGNYPVFIGGSYQRGRGFESVLSSVFRNLVVPAAKNVGKSLLRTGLQKSSNVLSGIAQGKMSKRLLWMSSQALQVQEQCPEKELL